MTTSAKLQRLKDKQLGDFKKCLMGLNERRAFDQLFAAAANNRMAISQAVDLLPVDAALMTMVIELQVEIGRLRAEIEELKGET